jgi:hypothetical protein
VKSLFKRLLYVNDYYYLLSLFFCGNHFFLPGPNKTVLMQWCNTFVRMLFSYQGPICTEALIFPNFSVASLQYPSETRFYTVQSALWLVSSRKVKSAKSNRVVLELFAQIACATVVNCLGNKCYKLVYPSIRSPVLVVLKNIKKFNFLKSRLKSRLNKHWTQVWTKQVLTWQICVSFKGFWLT